MEEVIKAMEKLSLEAPQVLWVTEGREGIEIETIDVILVQMGMESGRVGQERESRVYLHSSRQ